MGKPLSHSTGLEVVQDAWKTPYEQDLHELLLYNIDFMQHKLKYYANTAAFINSSGTGKSRLVDQMATLVFTIPFNLRDMTESTSKANLRPLC